MKASIVSCKLRFIPRTARRVESATALLLLAGGEDGAGLGVGVRRVVAAAVFMEIDDQILQLLHPRLGFFQPTIEQIFESKTLGQTMMPWSAFAVLYDTQNGWGPNKERALQLADAFARSNCSQETRDEARSCVISYELEQSRTPSGASHRR